MTLCQKEEGVKLTGLILSLLETLVLLTIWFFFIGIVHHFDIITVHDDGLVKFVDRMYLLLLIGLQIIKRNEKHDRSYYNDCYVRSLLLQIFNNKYKIKSVIVYP